MEGWQEDHSDAVSIPNPHSQNKLLSGQLSHLFFFAHCDDLLYIHHFKLKVNCKNKSSIKLVLGKVAHWYRHLSLEEVVSMIIVRNEVWFKMLSLA